MKKLMFSLCALCLVGAASAQVSAPLSARAQRALQQKPMSQAIEMQDVQTLNDRKARTDSVVYTQSAYGWDGKSYFSWLGDESTPDYATIGFCNEDEISFVYGTGFIISWSGTGEVGYRFAAGKGTFYNEAYLYPDLGVPYAVSTVISRAPSSGLLEDGKYPDMPFYFKIYDYTKVGPQRVMGGITEKAPKDYVDVVYPTNPERYSAYTDTLWVAAECNYGSKGIGQPGDTSLRAEFKDVVSWKKLGEDFCVSMVFPIDWDEKGDSIIDGSKWNAYFWTINGDEGVSRISENPHSVYYVVDFQKQALYNPREDGKRLDFLVEDSITQPNARYAIIPFDSWYWSKGGGSTTDEPLIRLYYSDWASLQSANKADRYVQVSPVPAVDYVNFTSYANMSRIEIYSLGGQLVKAVNVSGDTYRMDIAGLNSGMYVARIYSEKGISSKKLVVR